MEVLDILVAIKENERILSQEYLPNTRVQVLCKAIAEGQYLHAIGLYDSSDISSTRLLKCCNDENAFMTVRDKLLKFLGDEKSVRWLKFELMLLAIAYLELYCQVNYTGPELPPAELTTFTTIAHDNSIKELECDGSYAFRSIEVPQALLLARVILSTLMDPSDAGWRDGIVLDAQGAVARKKIHVPGKGSDTPTEEVYLHSIDWWAARAVVVHLRLLQKQGYEEVPTLWKEARDRFQVVLHNFASLPLETNLTTTAPHANVPPEQIQRWASGCRLHCPDSANVVLKEDWRKIQRQLAAQAWLEWGLCCMHFGFGDKVSVPLPLIHKHQPAIKEFVRPIVSVGQALFRGGQGSGGAPRGDDCGHG
jgi:hypothetical protein